MKNKKTQNKIDPIMFREWLTISEAAEHLSVFFTKKLNDPDIYVFALNGGGAQA